MFAHISADCTITDLSSLVSLLILQYGKNTSPNIRAKVAFHNCTGFTVCKREREEGKKREIKERNGTGECQRQRRRDRHREEDWDREIRELGTEEQPTINEFPREKEGHEEITEQKEKTEMTFLKGLLCGICRKKNEMWGPGRDGRRERACGEWNE